MPDSLVILRGVGKSYEPSVSVLSDINWSITPGERCVVLGSSGSGKSTLLSILGLLLRPSQGEVLVSGENAWRLSEKVRAAWRSAHLGYVWQDAGLLPELTILENVNLPLHIRDIPKREWNGRELVDRVGLTRRAHAYPSALSGGEAQRVAIARALAGSPSLVIADEPTGNLQQRQAEDICRLLLELQAELKFGLVVATHNETLIKHLQADPYWIVDGGISLNPPEEGL